MAVNLLGTFISEKISKIRWKHEVFSDAKNFLTGSWDDSVNKIQYWSIQSNEDNESHPNVTSSCAFHGDVTELQFIYDDTFVASSSLGSVIVLQLSNESPYAELKEHITWNSIHCFKTMESASCTSLSIFEQDIVTVGEDGRINLLTLQQRNPIRTISEADSCSLNCVDFLRHSEIVTGNIRGHMKVWDLRDDHNTPATTFMVSDQAKTEATSIAHHPTQKHIVVAGGGDGSLTVWDLRHNTYPVSQLSAHSKRVSEILFHQDSPENLFTCSISGELWHWNNTQHSKLTLDGRDSHWLNTIGGKGEVQVQSLCSPLHKPINSIDIDKSTLILGCDNEAIYIVKDINI